MSKLSKRVFCDMCGITLPAYTQKSEYFAQKSSLKIKINETVVMQDEKRTYKRKRKYDICPECMKRMREICVSREFNKNEGNNKSKAEVSNG